MPSNLVNGSGKLALAGKLAPAGSAATVQSRPGFSTKSCEPPELDDELLEELELDDELEELEEELELELEEELLELLEVDDELLEEELELELDELESTPPQAAKAEDKTRGAAKRLHGVNNNFIMN